MPTEEIGRQTAVLKTGALQNAILNSANFSSIATDENGVIQIFNVGAERMLGYSAIDVLNKITPADISDPDELVMRAKALSLELSTLILPGFEALIFKASRGIEDIYELTYIRKDGSRLPAVVSVTALRDERKGIIGYLLIGTDNTARKLVELDKANQALRAEITERRKTIKALGESEAQFRQVVENIHEVFWIADAQKGSVQYVSPTYEKIWGRSCQSAYSGSHIGLDAVYPDDSARIRQAKQNKQAAGTYDEEFRIVRPDGSLRWIHERAFPVRNAAGDLLRVIGVAEDITERKQLEEQFRQAQKMEAIGTLAGGIAHDFNNILTAIIGYTELADMTVADNPKVHGFLGGVLQAARRATGLIRQILTFSRQQAEERRPIKLMPIVEESLKLLRATIPSTIEFDTSLAANAPTILADATQIHQILMNLGTNAWYAMRSRTGRLRVKLERWIVDEEQAVAQPQLKSGAYARVSVGDTGCGMDQATLRRVFEPFFTTKPSGEGTGLGLAVVHGIMDSHDGAITVSSQPGNGTTFYLYFPAYEGEAIVAPATEGPVMRGNGERILVIDDEEVLALLLQRALTTLGYEAEFSTRPEDALARVRADPHRFALVLTDQTMPSMTGLLLASNLREIRPGIPVIMMTGYTAPRMSERVAAAGIHNLLLKPITIHSLGVAVHAALTAMPTVKSVSEADELAAIAFLGP